MTAPLVASTLPLPLLRRGKVREVYEVDAGTLLLVASDRVSAFDVVMREPVAAQRGGAHAVERVLVRRARDRHAALTCITADADEIVQRVPAVAGSRDMLIGRAMLARRTTPIPFECVVRGYISGSAWAEYEKSRHARRGAAAGGTERERTTRSGDFLPRDQGGNGP